MSALPPDVLKVRLDVVLALRTGEGVVDAVGAWMSVEPDAVERMGACMVEAIVQVLGDDHAFEIVIWASDRLGRELLEVRNGSL